MEAFKNWFASLAVREQRGVLVGAAACVALLLLALVLPFERRVLGGTARPDQTSGSGLA